MAATEGETATAYVADDRHTKSLDRAELVLAYFQAHPGDPIPVQEIAERVGSYYEEVLHIATTLEALRLVSRYKRAGAPREGARVAYAWVQPVKKRTRRGKVTPMEALRRRSSAA